MLTEIWPKSLNPYCAGCGVAGNWRNLFTQGYCCLNPYCAGCGVAGVRVLTEVATSEKS